jgi:arginase
VRVRGEDRDAETGILASADVLTATATIQSTVAERMRAGERPFLAGGCCAELPGALADARDALGSIGLVHLDGHLDLYDGVTSPTGEAADMPVSVALGLGPRMWVELGPLFSSSALAGVSLGCYNPEKDPDRACGRALVKALST